MLLPWEVAVLAGGTVVVLLYQGWALWLAAEMPRLAPEGRSGSPPEGPRVSAVIAARNEELDLPAALASLRAQDLPPSEVVVVDGGSTDGTRAILENEAPFVRTLEEPPLPAGWVGKNWACWTGARATSGEWLWFLDADVRLHPSALRTTIDWAQREEASLATIAPRVEAVGTWERIVLPFYVQMVLTYFRAPHVNRPDSRAAMANGQFWLVRRSEYDRFGGHAAVAGQLLEDVAIAERFRAAGKRLRVAWAPDLAVTRMYRDRKEMFEGIRKTVHGTAFSAARSAGFLAGLVALFWLPLAVLPIGLLEGGSVVIGLGLALWIALFGKHAAFARAVGVPAAYGLLYPVAVGFYLAAIASSLWRGSRAGTVPWKGRAYPVRPPGDSRTAK